MSKKDKDILIYEFKKTRGTRDYLLIALKKCFEQLHDQQPCKIMVMMITIMVL